MKKSDFSSVLANTPTFIPVFRLLNIPQWAKDHRFNLSVGDECTVDSHGTLFLKTKSRFNITASSLEFVEYRQIR
jgi:hypothetical protein